MRIIETVGLLLIIPVGLVGLLIDLQDSGLYIIIFSTSFVITFISAIFYYPLIFWVKCPDCKKRYFSHIPLFFIVDRYCVNCKMRAS